MIDGHERETCSQIMCNQILCIHNLITLASGIETSKAPALPEVVETSTRKA